MQTVKIKNADDMFLWGLLWSAIGFVVGGLVVLGSLTL